MFDEKNNITDQDSFTLAPLRRVKLHITIEVIKNWGQKIQTKFWSSTLVENAGSTLLAFKNRKQHCVTIACLFFIYFSCLPAKLKIEEMKHIFLLCLAASALYMTNVQTVLISYVKAVNRANKIQFLFLELQSTNDKNVYCEVVNLTACMLNDFCFFSTTLWFSM